MDIELRQERPEDLAQVHDVVAAAFAQEDEAVLVDRLRGCDEFVPELSLVALDGDTIVGHVLFTRAHVVRGESRHEVLALAPVSVAPSHQRTGVGSALIDEGHRIAGGLGFRASIVLGHPEYYPRFGYSAAKEFDIGCPFPAPDEAFMALALVEGGLEGVHGILEYAAPFNS